MGDAAGMVRWVCPQCSRQFARTNQTHECAPPMAIEEYFATGPAFERGVFEAVMVGLEGIGPIHVEPVSVGIFLKRSRSFAELRPMTKWVAVSFSLHRTIRSSRIARKVIVAGERRFHVVNVAGSQHVDGELLSWLTEAYDVSPD